MAEHWFCKPVVVGSSPTASFPAEAGVAPDAETNDGQVAERPMASDCKSDGFSLRGFESLPAH